MYKELWTKIKNVFGRLYEYLNTRGTNCLLEHDDTHLCIKTCVRNKKMKNP